MTDIVQQEEKPLIVPKEDPKPLDHKDFKEVPRGQVEQPPVQPTPPETKKAEEPKVEEKKADEPKQPEQTEEMRRISKSFAQLAGKEKAFVRRQQEAKAELDKLRGELEEKEKGLSARQAEYESFQKFKEEARLDPRKALSALGWDYNKLSEFFINDFKIPPEQRVEELRKELESHKRELTEKEKKQIEEQQKAAHKVQEERRQELQQRVAEAEKKFREEAQKFVAANADKYELTHLYGRDDLVVEVIELYHGKYGKLLSYEEACQQVENHLEEQARKSKKLQPPKVEPPKPVVPAPQRSSIAELSATTHPPVEKMYDEQEAKRRAMLVLDGINPDTGQPIK